VSPLSAAFSVTALLAALISRNFLDHPWLTRDQSPLSRLFLENTPFFPVHFSPLHSSTSPLTTYFAARVPPLSPFFPHLSFFLPAERSFRQGGREDNLFSFFFREGFFRSPPFFPHLPETPGHRLLRRRHFAPPASSPGVLAFFFPTTRGPPFVSSILPFLCLGPFQVGFFSPAMDLVRFSRLVPQCFTLFFFFSFMGACNLSKRQPLYRSFQKEGNPLRPSSKRPISPSFQ